MQINHHYHRNSFGSLRAMFDPAQNVDYAATFLRRLKNRHKTWVMAVARYHAGPSNNRAQRKYVCRVLAHMVSQSLARHTGKTRKICNIR
ncbi:MAG: transglycosylase SLT domain-containing protein [Rhizobiaceae bacterium]